MITFNDIKPRDRVTFNRYAGWKSEYKPATGTAVMRGPHGWVLNMGGPHGTPAVVDEKHFISARRKKNA